MSNKPDAIVKEETAREAVDRIVGGFATDARAAGKLPQLREIEDFARPIVDRQIKIHEERCRNGVPEPVKQAPVPVVDSETPTGDKGVRKMQRHLGVVDWQPGTGQMQVRGKLHPKLAQRLARQAAVPVEADAREQAQLRKRLDLLGSYPEWSKRVHDAYFFGAGVATQQLLEQGMYTITEVENMDNGVLEDVRRVATQHAMKVVEESDRLFGDWKTA